MLPCWLFALHLLAHLLVSQQSPVELGGPDYPVRSADPPAAGGIRHLQSGTLTNLTHIAHALYLFCCWSSPLLCWPMCHSDFQQISLLLCFQAKTEISAKLITMLTWVCILPTLPCVYTFGTVTNSPKHAWVASWEFQKTKLGDIFQFTILIIFKHAFRGKVLILV